MHDSGPCTSHSVLAAGERFSPEERHFLLHQPGIGSLVVDRLEQAGIVSMAQLRRTGVPAAVITVCAMLGEIAWANRRRSLERAVASHAIE